MKPSELHAADVEKVISKTMSCLEAHQMVSSSPEVMKDDPVEELEWGNDQWCNHKVRIFQMLGTVL